jgi:hypothetical protein
MIKMYLIFFVLLGMVYLKVGQNYAAVFIGLPGAKSISYVQSPTKFITQGL